MTSSHLQATGILTNHVHVHQPSPSVFHARYSNRAQMNKEETQSKFSYTTLGPITRLRQERLESVPKWLHQNRKKTQCSNSAKSASKIQGSEHTQQRQKKMEYGSEEDLFQKL